MPVVTTRSEALLALGLPPDATHQDTMRAFRKLSLQHHPDRAGEHDQFITILSAKEVLLEGPNNCGTLRETSPAGDASEWTVPGARARVPVPRTSLNQTRYYAPFLDSLFGPSPFERCKESIRRGSVSYSCACEKCEHADLYAPLRYGEHLKGRGSSVQTDPPSEDAPSSHHSDGKESSPSRREGSFADRYDDDGVDSCSSIIVISDDEDDLCWLRFPDAVDSRCAFSEYDSSEAVFAPHTRKTSASASTDKFTAQFKSLSLEGGHNVTGSTSNSSQNTANLTTLEPISQNINEVDSTATSNRPHKHGGQNGRRKENERGKRRRRKRSKAESKTLKEGQETPPK
jgi:DnaJ domain